MKQAGPVVSQSMREYPDTKLMPEVPGLEDLEKEKAYWNNRMSPLASLRGKINKQEFHDAFDKVLSLNEQIHKAIEKAGIPREIGVIGSGPGGLTLAINGPQEAYDTVLLDAATSTGGQARYSAWLQNITGFKGGTTGYNYYQETFNNARRMGAQFKLGNRATELNRDPNSGIYYVKS